MPIHDFGNKETPKETPQAPKVEAPKVEIPEVEITQPEVPKLKIVIPKPVIKKSSHPMVYGLLDIEEEDF